MNQEIEFRFPTVRPKLQNLFPFDPKYDIEIIFRNNRYELQTAYLRLESGLFKSLNPSMSKVIKISEDFDQDYFEQIMKCFYGGLFRCSRNVIFEVWKIFDYLKIETFKKHAINDMKLNFQSYNLFQLMTFAFINSIDQVFTNCLSILDSYNFIQLKKNKQQLLSCPLELFKFLVNTNNRRPKPKRALNYLEVNELLASYSQKNEFSQEFHKELKFNLIEKTQLTAEQYRLIFIQGAKPQSVGEIPEISSNKIGLKVSSASNLVESAQVLSIKPVAIQQKEHWRQKLQNLKQNFQKNKNDTQILQNSIHNLSKFIKSKTQESKIKEKNLSKMQNLIREIENQINEKRSNLKKITERIQKIQIDSIKKNVKTYKEKKIDLDDNDIFVESHIIPGFCSGDIINDAQIAKKQSVLKGTVAPNIESTLSIFNFIKNNYQFRQTEKLKQSINQNNYKNSLIFDREPESVPKRYLDCLANLLDIDSFIKKRHLKLLFRRSKTQKNNIGDPSSIRNRPGLLILFQTSEKKYAGGYISVEIPSFVKADSICDYRAFIFSLTHSVKMPIMKGEQKSAISLSKHYLLSFANDLMISHDCLEQVSYCEWPGIYSVPENSKCKSAKELVGSSEQFKIQQIEIYEVKNQSAEMVL